MVIDHYVMIISNIKPMMASVFIIFESTIVLYRAEFDREPLCTDFTDECSADDCSGRNEGL